MRHAKPYGLAGLLAACLMLQPPARGQWGAGCEAGPASPAFAPPFSQPAAPLPQPFTPPPQPRAAPAAPSAPEWRPVPGHPGQFALVEGGVQVGAWDAAARYYRPIVGGEWGAKEDSPPVAPPAWAAQEKKCGCACYPCRCKEAGKPCEHDDCKCVPKREKKEKAGGCCGCECPRCKGDCSCRERGRPCGDNGCPCVVAAGGRVPARDAVPESLNFGVRQDKLGGAKRYLLGGRHGLREVTRTEAVRELDRLPDDAGSFRLVLVGDEASRKRVQADVDAGALGEHSGRVLVHSYPPDSPLVRQRGYVSQGSPSITVMCPRGRVLARNLKGGYPGPDRLKAGVAAAVARHDPAAPVPPGYDPARDADLFAEPEPKPEPKPDPKPGPGPGPAPVNPQAPPWAWALGGAVIVLLLLQLRKDQK